MTHSLTAPEIALIRDAYERISVGRRLAQKFYERLFEIAPELRRLFPESLSAQVTKLSEMLDVLVRDLDRPRELARILERLGERHARYGVTPRDFAPVGRALFETLEGELGPGFDDPMRRAWIALYALVSELMQEPERNAQAG